MLRNAGLRLANACFRTRESRHVVSRKGADKFRRFAGRLYDSRLRHPVLAGCSGALAACAAERRRPLPVDRTAPTGVEGSWTDPNGTVSTFQAAPSRPRTTDTDQKLADRQLHQYLAPTSVEINMHLAGPQTRSPRSIALLVSIQPAQLHQPSGAAVLADRAQSEPLVRMRLRIGGGACFRPFLCRHAMPGKAPSFRFSLASPQPRCEHADDAGLSTVRVNQAQSVKRFRIEIGRRR